MSFLGKLRAKDIAVRAMLGPTANRTDPTGICTRLACEVKKRGGVVINGPELTAFSVHKARLHEELARHNVPVPDTVMAPREQVGH